MKKILVLATVCAGVIAGYLFWTQRSNGQTIAAKEAATVQVERGSIRLTVESTGRVISNRDVEIMSQASGEIISLPYDVSDSIEKGILLVELDPEDEERNVRQAKVNLTSSEAKLAQARQNLKTAEQQLVNDEAQAKANLLSAQAQHQDAQAKAERMRKLLASNRVSQEECETAETSATLAATTLENARIRLKELEVEREALETKRQDVVLAECQVDSDRLSRESAQERLDDTKIYAPIAGVISALDVQIGNIVSSPMSNVGGGTTLLTLSDLSRMFVEASVDESDIGQIEVGQAVDVTADAFPDKHFEGEVVRIATKGDNVSNVVTFEVKIEVLGEGKEKLKPEMTANVEILVADKQDVLLLSSEALHGAGERQYVLLLGPNGQQGERRRVQTGVDDGLQVEIVEGLKEGEEVIVSSGDTNSQWSQAGRQEGPGPGRMMMGAMGGGPPPR